MSEQLKYMGPWRDQSLMFKTCVLLNSPWRCLWPHKSLLWRCIFSFIQHILTAGNMLLLQHFWMAWKMCCPPWKKFLCHIHLDAQNADSGKMAFYPAFDCSPVLLSGLSWIDPNIYCNHTISFTFLLFNEIKMWVLCWGVSKAGGGWDWDLALVPVSVVLECV